MNWRKHLWGIEFCGSLEDDKPMMLGTLWHDLVMRRSTYAGEPTRALLFQNRAAARAWCKEQMDKNRDRTDRCGQWRFRPIRVIETVRPA